MFETCISAVDSIGEAVYLERGVVCFGFGARFGNLQQGIFVNIPICDYSGRIRCDGGAPATYRGLLVLFCDGDLLLVARVDLGALTVDESSLYVHRPKNHRPIR